MNKPLILGLSASLRYARSNKGIRYLLEELSELKSRNDLDAFIDEQANIHLEQFNQAGREEQVPFDALYRKLRSMGGLRGLSNSEVCLLAALWGAQDNGADVEMAALADCFPANGGTFDLDQLKALLLKADGIILASPVYFGDRSSISHRFIEMIRADDELRKKLAGKIYAGVTVGAKRNGGQETALIYQMIDMINLGFLAVGNDSDTTSQYGGTAHAGDIGTIPKDSYGIDTCVGTGRRIAHVAAIMRAGDETQLKDKPRAGAWIMQDRDNELVHRLDDLFATVEAPVDMNRIDMLAHAIRPCIACDVCPTEVGPDEEYRCIIKRKDDGIKNAHEELIKTDVILPCALSVKDHTGLKSMYQQFMERTRYLRRGDYVFTDCLVAPILFAEVGSSENLHVRMITSLIRHHTVIHKPIIGWVHNGELLNADEVRADLETALHASARLVTGRLRLASSHSEITRYHPVGYILSLARDNETDVMAARERLAEERQNRLQQECEERIKS